MLCFQTLGSGVLQGISTVENGNLSFKWGPADRVADARKRFLEQAGLPVSDCVAMCCEHDGMLAEVDESNRGAGILDGATSIHADALITSTRNVGLFLLTADCIPAVLYDPVTPALGLAHLSWKTTETKLAAKVVREMSVRFGTVPADLRVGIGPAIRQHSYAFTDPIQRTLPGWEPYLTDRADGQTAIDIAAYNADQLVAEGVGRERIEDLDVDTATSAEFFSHYRSARTDEPEGRFATVAMLRRPA